MRSSRALDVMVIEQMLDPELPLSLYERLRTAMTVRSIPHGAQALRLIEAGATPDIVVVDRRAPGVDLAAMQRLLQMRTDTATARVSFIDAERALLCAGDADEPIALLHGLGTTLDRHDDADGGLHDC
jgi:CheY-like chemotaxis protein